MSLGVLYNPMLSQGSLLDAIKYSETGHLTDDKARTAVSRAGAVGPYQFMQKFLPDFGYGMPKNIPLADVQDTEKSRQLADQFVSGYSQYHNFETPLEKLVAYNAGPNFAAKWKAAGAKIADLPAETQKYVQRAAAFLTRKGNDDMAYLGMPSEDDGNVTIGGQVISEEEAARRVLEEAQQQARIRQERMRANAPTMNISAYPEGFTMASPPPPPPSPEALDAAMGMTMAMPTPPPAPVLAPSDDVVQSNNALMQAMGISPAAASSSGPALTYSSTPSRSGGSGQVSQNRRDRSAMSMVPPPQQIGFNEMLIRMGAAGLGASAQGGLQSLEAMGRTYGEIKDINRATGLAAYQAQMDALKDGSTAKGREERLKQAGKIDETLFDMQRALNALESGQSVTGWFDSTVGAVIDDAMGNPEAGTRLLLKKLKVDDALLRVAQTKGAISNKEMGLFLDPAPKDYQDEDIWMQWIRDRMVALQNIRQRLATGETVADPASQQQIDQFGSTPQQGGNFADADAIVGIN